MLTVKVCLVSIFGYRSFYRGWGRGVVWMRNCVIASPYFSPPQFIQKLLSCFISCVLLNTILPHLSSPLMSLHLSLLLSSPLYCKCLRLLTMAVRAVEEGGHRLPIEVHAFSSSVQSQLWPQGGEIKMDCKRCMCVLLCVCALHPDAHFFPPLFAQCTYYLYVGWGFQLLSCCSLTFSTSANCFVNTFNTYIYNI